MALESKPLDREPIIYFSTAQGGPTVAPNQTLAARQGFPATTAWIYMHGQRRIVGVFVTDQAPAAGFPRFRFGSTVGGGGTIVADITYQLVADPLQPANTFRFDFAIPSVYGVFEFTNGAVAANVHVQAWMFPEGTGPDVGVVPSPASATIFTKDAPLTDKGYVQDTTTTSAAAVPLQGVAAAVAAGAIYAQVQSENFAWRWRSDGVAPTATVGNLVQVGVNVFLEDAQLAAMQVIGVNAAPSVINVNYWA